MHALKKLSLLPTAPADSVGVQRRQRGGGRGGGDKRILLNLELGETKVLPQWSAPMKTQHNGFHP